MREIKFRGKTEQGEWIYGDLYHHHEDTVISTLGVITNYKVVPETVGQYTGLKDKNGKEIWEGDRVKHNMPIDNLIDVVVYSGGAFILKGKGSLSAGVLEGHYGGCEVIGNINDKEADNEKNKD